MRFDIEAAESFMATHARVLDRRRLQLLLGRADPADVHAALAAYRNKDGGYGWGLEPDLRVAESQPAAAMLALEVLAEAAPASTPPDLELFDWLASLTLPDGGLPFVASMTNPVGCARHWVDGDPIRSSLQMTTQVAANAHVLGRHQPAVAGHPWLATATEFCLAAIRDIDQDPHAYELLFALRFLDAIAQDVPEADVLLSSLGRLLPPSGSVPVQGGAEGETLHPLAFAPDPHRPVRELFTAEAVAADLERLLAQQKPDGGWSVDWTPVSAAAALEWRGYVTLAAVRILQSNAL
jgi:hypothetical protein